VETLKEGTRIRQVIFMLKGFPELTKSPRECICGYLKMLGGATGEKKLEIKLEESDPEAWRWIIQLE
jgi:hypothetical protein